MIDLLKARNAFKVFINQYENKSHVSFNLKVIHTYKVSENAKMIAINLDLNTEDIELAELIGILHDIGRFDEIITTGECNSMKFDHAKHASKILFEDNHIRDFIDDNKYDYIIKKSIENHNCFRIEEGLDEKVLLHCKVLRDADKLDIFRVKKEAELKGSYPRRVNKLEDIEESLISDKIYEAVLKEECVLNSDRKYPLDYLVSNMAYVFDLNFIMSFKILKNKNYLNDIIDRFNYKNPITKNRMEEIKKIFNNFIDRKIN